MAFDLASILGSTIISATVALTTASWKVGREERAKRAEAAKARIRSLVADLIRSALARRQDPKGTIGAEASTSIGRYQFASEIVFASDDLSSIRRRLVRWRLRKLVGFAVAETAKVAPGKTTSESAIPMVVTMLAHRKHPKIMDPGLLAVLADDNVPTDHQLQAVIRSLKRLRECR